MIGKKHIFSPEDISFIRENFHAMTNRGLAKAVGSTLTVLRNQCYSMGLKRIEMEYFTSEQLAFVKEYYPVMGDTEIAEYLQKMYPKNKPWTNKHIDKKREYMGWIRTPEMIRAIRKRNIANGRFAMCPVKRWDVTGRAKEGEIRIWKNQLQKPIACIKVNGMFTPWARWAWQQEHGKIPAGMVVCFINDNPTDLRLDNLELLSRGDAVKKHGFRSYPPELQKAILTINKLTKTIRNNEQ